MNAHRRWPPVAVLALATASIAAGPEPSRQTKGVTARQLATVDLGAEIEGMSGRELRTRVVTIEPGGVLALHNHRDRPGTVYVLQGTVTEHRGESTRVFVPGDTWSEDRETTHWIENTTTTPAVVIAVDIVKR